MSAHLGWPHSQVVGDGLLTRVTGVTEPRVSHHPSSGSFTWWAWKFQEQEPNRLVFWGLSSEWTQWSFQHLHWPQQGISPAQIQGIGEILHLSLEEMQSHIAKCVDAGKGGASRQSAISLPKAGHAGQFSHSQHVNQCGLSGSVSSIPMQLIPKPAKNSQLLCGDRFNHVNGDLILSFIF